MGRSAAEVSQSALESLIEFQIVGGDLLDQDVDVIVHVWNSRCLHRQKGCESVRCVFNDHVLSYFEQKRGVGTEGGGDQLIFYRSEKRIHPYQMRFFMEDGFRVLELFKQ